MRFFQLWQAIPRAFIYGSYVGIDSETKLKLYDEIS